MHFAGWDCLQAADKVQISLMCGHSGPRMKTHLCLLVNGKNLWCSHQPLSHPLDWIKSLGQAYSTSAWRGRVQRCWKIIQFTQNCFLTVVRKNVINFSCSIFGNFWLKNTRFTVTHTYRSMSNIQSPQPSVRHLSLILNIKFFSPFTLLLSSPLPVTAKSPLHSSLTLYFQLVFQFFIMHHALVPQGLWTCYPLYSTHHALLHRHPLILPFSAYYS